MDNRHMTTLEARRVETYLRLQAEALLRGSCAEALDAADTSRYGAVLGTAGKPDSGPRKSLGGWPPHGLSWLRWLASQAWALADVGAVDDATANSVVRDLSQALAARGAAEDFGWRGGEIRPAEDSSLPTGPMRIVHVGAAVDGELEGGPFPVRLGTMLLCPDTALLTMTARPPAVLAAPGPGVGRLRSMMQALRQWPTTDDKGASYRLSFSGGGNGELWEGMLRFHPGPPGDARWLDIGLPGAEPLRVSLDTAPAATTATKALPAGEAAERYVDALAFQLFHNSCSGDHRSGRDMGAAVCGLLGAGVLAADSPALGRLAAVASRLRRRVELPDVPPAVLPEHWQRMLRRRRARNGPVGVIPFAAVLPELDGTRCAILRVSSEQDSATIDVYARGWPYRHLLDGDDGPFFWTARDDAGGCYVASSEFGSRSSDGEAQLALDLRPAINPRARELEVILTGRTGEVSVSVPLDWQEEL
jgi:hypothetical protein